MTERADAETGEVFQTAMPAPIVKAILGVMKDVKQLGYDEKNSFQNYQYVSIDKFLATFGKLMAENGLVLSMDEEAVEIRASGKTGETPDGKEKASSWLHARFRFMLFHETGASYGPIFRTVMVPANGAQAFGSAQSYLIKQFLRGLFFVPTGDKDDPDAQDKASIPATTEGGTRPAPKQTAASAAPKGSDREFAKTAYEAIRAQVAQAVSLDDVEAVVAANKANLDMLEKDFPKNFKTLSDFISARKSAVSKIAREQTEEEFAP